MKLADFNIGPSLTATFAVLIALILGGNALLIWQFRSARIQTELLTGVSQQMFEVLRLQPSVLAFHQQVDELLLAKDQRRLETEGDLIRATLLQQTQRTRNALSQLSPQIRVDPDLRATLETIDLALPSELDAVTALGGSGDWDAVRVRLSKQLKPIEDETAQSVGNLDREVSAELARSAANMGTVQSRINMIVPATAVCTFFVAAFFGWAFTRKVILLRAEERINERLRIGRDLHDTLLQSFQGLLMQFYAFAHRLPDGSESRTILDGIIGQAQQAMLEGRDAVEGLRSSVVLTNDLARSISAFGKELCAELEGQPGPEFFVRVDGASRELYPLVRSEIHRIACEAVRNAVLHAESHRIGVEIRYDPRQLVVKVQDDGKGVDPGVLAAGGRVGHYGLRGMRERAKLVRGTISISSELGAGTEIELTVPGSQAYLRKLPAPRRSISSRDNPV